MSRLDGIRVACTSISASCLPSSICTGRGQGCSRRASGAPSSSQYCRGRQGLGTCGTGRSERWASGPPTRRPTARACSPCQPKGTEEEAEAWGQTRLPQRGSAPTHHRPQPGGEGCAPHLGVAGQQVQVLPVVRLKRLHLATEPLPLHHVPAESARTQLPGQGGEGLALRGQRLQDLEEEAVSTCPPRPGTRPRRGRRTCRSIRTTSRSSSRHRKGYSENRPLCTSPSRWFLVSRSTRHSAFSQWSRRVCRVFRCEARRAR